MAEYDPYDWAFLEDPYPGYRALRDEAPVAHNADLDVYALSRFADVWDAVHDPETFSSARGISILTDGPSDPPQLIETDPPRHTKLRKLVSRAFTPRRVAGMEPAIRELTRTWLDPLVARGEGDLIGDFAAKLPMDVISTMLGVPRSDHDMLREWADAMLEVEQGATGISDAGRTAMVRMGGYFFGDVPRRRAEPADDLVSALCHAEIDGEALADADIAGFCVLLAIAGNETTTKLIGHMAFHLQRHPDARRAATADPALVPGVVEETTRYDPSSQMVARTTTRDVELHGTTIPAGRKVALLVGSACRDEREFAEPDRFDPHREMARTVAFGHGAHVCLGAALARLEGRVALEELLARAPDYELDEAGARRTHSPHVRGFSTLPVRFPTPVAPGR